MLKENFIEHEGEKMIQEEFLSEIVVKEKAQDHLDRARVVELVRKWAGVNSDGILDPGTKIFSVPHIEGLIGYKIESHNAVVYGDPVCAPKDKPALALAFQDFCKSKHIGVVYTIVTKEFSDWATTNLPAVSVEFGETFRLDPMQNPMNKTGSKAVLVRKKVKHALSEGAVVEEYIGDDPEIERGIEEVARSWLQGRHGPQVFLAQVTLFNDRVGKRWFYAKQGNEIVAFLLINEMQSKNGWLLNNVMHKKTAPHGCSELLVISTLQSLEKENCHFVLMGPVPARQLGHIVGIGHFTASLLRWFYKSARKIFHLSGHQAFWEKFMPEVEASYLLFPQKNVSFSSIKALLKAFNVGG